MLKCMLMQQSDKIDFTQIEGDKIYAYIPEIYQNRRVLTIQN